MVDPEAGTRRRELSEAVTATAEAEWEWASSADHAERVREKYRLVMQACEATGDCPRENVCWYAKRLVERRMWELFGRPKGLGREDFRIPHSTWYDVGRELGYTDSFYSRRSGEGGAASPEIPRPARKKAEAKPDHSSENRRYIVALNNAGDAMQVVAEWMSRFPVKGNVEREVSETMVAVCESFSKNVHDLSRRNRIVPTNAQQMFIDTMRTVLRADKGVRQFLVNVAAMATVRAKERSGKRAMSTPEANKYRARSPKELHMSLEPAGEYEAQWLGFHGQRCAKCASWRMLPSSGSPDVLECIRCLATAPRLATILCRSCSYRIPHGEGKCGQCGEASDNPYAGRAKK